MILLAKKADSLASSTKCYQNQGHALLANECSEINSNYQHRKKSQPEKNWQNSLGYEKKLGNEKALPKHNRNK